jgi:hypothetical protein
MHPWLTAHFLPWATQLPPQSTSVSFWFFARSAQVGAWHTAMVHTLLVQSVPSEHTLPFAHAPHVVPPQSTSVSFWFFTTSMQVGVWQMPPVQTPLAQSPATEQLLPFAHFLAGAHAPPQSMSVSLPFFTTSLQFAAAHALPVQTPLTQSVPPAHPRPVPHRAQVVAPPQSVPVSLPFLIMSLQLDAWHAFIVQTVLAQSLGAVQALLVAHR